MRSCCWAARFDLFDGRVARVSGLASKFGAFYDSTLDRISEGVVYLGLLSLYNRYLADVNDVTMIYLILLAMSGSFMVSYTKARAEALGLECPGGLMQRPERIVLLGGGSLLFWFDVGGQGHQHRCHRCGPAHQLYSRAEDCVGSAPCLRGPPQSRCPGFRSRLRPVPRRHLREAR